MVASVDESLVTSASEAATVTSPVVNSDRPHEGQKRLPSGVTWPHALHCTAALYVRWLLASGYWLLGPSALRAGTRDAEDRGRAIIKARSGRSAAW